MRKPFTLLEICLAIAIFAIGVLTAMGVLVPAVRWGAEAQVDFSVAGAALTAVEYFNAGGFNREWERDGKNIEQSPPLEIIYTGKIGRRFDANDTKSPDIGELYYPYAVKIKVDNGVLNFKSGDYTDSALVQVYRKRVKNPFEDEKASEFQTGESVVFKTVEKISTETVLSAIDDKDQLEAVVYFEMRVNLLRQSIAETTR